METNTQELTKVTVGEIGRAERIALEQPLNHLERLEVRVLGKNDVANFFNGYSDVVEFVQCKP